MKKPVCGCIRSIQRLNDGIIARLDIAMKSLYAPDNIDGVPIIGILVDASRLNESAVIDTVDLSRINAGNVRTLDYMFKRESGPTVISVVMPESLGRNVDSVSAMEAFEFTRIHNIDFNNCRADLFQAQNMFKHTIELRSVAFGNVTAISCSDFSGMFCFCANLEDIDMSRFNIREGKNFNAMCGFCSKLNSFKLCGKCSGIVNFTDAFRECGELNNVILPDMRGCDNVVCDGMFHKCKKLRSVRSLESLCSGKISDEDFGAIDLRVFGTNSEIRLSKMFGINNKSEWECTGKIIIACNNIINDLSIDEILCSSERSLIDAVEDGKKTIKRMKLCDKNCDIIVRAK